MEETSLPPTPLTVEEVFKDFLGRRAGILKALTYDVEDFFQQCDPEKENLCLYGFPDEVWEVNLPVEEVPPELPEPVLGINFARDGMQQKDWLSLVAVHSDAWLMSVAFYFGAKFDKNERMKLFNMITDLPTVLDIVSGRHPLTERVSIPKVQKVKPPPVKKPVLSASLYEEDDDNEDGGDAYDEDEVEAKDEEDEDEGQESTLCGSCGEIYGPNEFWICCDICERWFHGKCVKVTPAKAENMKQYKCPSCSKKLRF